MTGVQFDKIICPYKSTILDFRQKNRLLLHKMSWGELIFCPYKPAILWRQLFDWHEIGARILCLLFLWIRITWHARESKTQSVCACNYSIVHEYSETVTSHQQAGELYSELSDGFMLGAPGPPTTGQPSWSQQARPINDASTHPAVRLVEARCPIAKYFAIDFYFGIYCVHGRPD